MSGDLTIEEIFLDLFWSFCGLKLNSEKCSLVDSKDFVSILNCYNLFLF